jgi:thiosulfate/3-mercaptopyruvate sulfurtransferase
MLLCFAKHIYGEKSMWRNIFMLLVLMSVSISSFAADNSLFVDTDWLASHKDDKNIVVVDMSGSTQYQRFHVPGAVHLDYGDLVMRRRDGVSVRVPDSHLVKVLGGIGINADSHVVIYDDIGGLNAGRLYWELERFGHKKISVVRGGLVKWILEGRKVTNKPVKPVVTAYVPAGKGKENNIDMQDVLKLSTNGSAVLLDVRSEDEYLGHPRYPRTGHIPGSLWWPWENNVDFDNAFVNKDDKTVQSVLDKLGIKDKNEELIVYCRSGHRAAQAYLTLRELGYENVKLYDGSMAEYSMHKGNPLEKGSCKKC